MLNSFKNTISKTTTARKTFVVLAILAIAGLAFGPGEAWRPIFGPAGIGERGGNSAGGGDGGQLVGTTLIGSALAQGNLPPVADAGFDQTFAVGATVTLDGSGTTDPKGKVLSFSWSIVSAPAGSAAALSDASAVKPSFAIDQPGDYVFELVVTQGNRTSQPDQVTVSTVNTAPIAEAGPDQAINLGDTVELDAGASRDVDGDGLSYAWSLVSAPAGSAAALSDAAAVRPSFFADLGGTYVAQLIANDGAVSSAADTVTLTTANVAPVADTGPDQVVTVGQTVFLIGDRSYDADGDKLKYLWDLIARPAGSIAVTSTPNENRPELLIDEPGLYVVQLEVDDGNLDSVRDTMTISTVNTPPMADAGPDQSVLAGAEVTLDGAGSFDVDGDSLSYAWALLSTPAGSVATLSDAGAVRPTFTADIAGDYVAQLIVEDGAERSLADTVTVTTSNSAPIADAGPDQTIATPTTIQLDGGASSDADSDPLTFFWSVASRPKGGNPSLSDPSAVNPTFQANKAGTYIFQLIVNDGALDGAPETVTVTTLNSRPVAAAGPDQTVAKATLVQLDGSASNDADNDPLTQRWALVSVPADSAAALSNPGIVNPTFTPDLPGDYVAQLIVSDGALDANPDTVVITATNTAPVANAGPDQTIVAGALVQLDGSASSDPDNDPITFAWSLISVPAGSAAALSDSTIVNPTFTADLPGTYTARLIVNDGFDDSDPDQVTITATNTPPIADAGLDQQVIAGTTVQLDGSASSDAEGQPLTFAWSLTTVPAGSTATLSNPNIVNPTFVADLTGTYTAQLIVDDGFDPSAPDSATITAFPVGTNLAPVLDPVGNQTVALGSTLNLTLTASDANNDPLAFSATPLPLPAGAALNGATGVFTFQPDATQVGVINLTFTVSDGFLIDSESISITVTGPTGVTAMTGRVLDANVADQGGPDLPIEGATVSILGGGTPVLTDANGNFTLTGIPSGEQIFDIDTATVINAPAGVSYAGFREAFDLIADVTNVVDRPFFLPRIDPASLTPVNAGVETSVVNPSLGITLDVPPDTAEKDGMLFNCQNMPADCELSISEVPPDLAPVALPEELQPGTLISIQPVGVTFATPVPITFSNSENFAPGSRVDIYSLSSVTGNFLIVGTGQVSADGTVIETISGGIQEATWHFVAPSLPGIAGVIDDSQDPGMCTACITRSSTHVNTGNLTEDHTLASYRSLGSSRALRFVYNSTSADPQPIVTTDVTNQALSFLPDSFSSKIRVAGVDQGAPVFTSTSGLSNTVDETIHQAVQFDASGFATGSYLYDFMVTSNFAATKITSVFGGTLLVNNEAASPFGAGWTLAGLSRLHTQGGLVLTAGDGSIKRFFPAPAGSGTFGPAANFGAITNPLAHAVDDFNNDGFPDLVVPGAGTGRVFILLNDGSGQFPTINEVPTGFAGAADNIAVATGNFNNDAFRDFAVGHTTGGFVTVHLGSATGAFSLSASLFVAFGTGGGSFGSIGVEDFDEDGRDDIAASQQGFNNRVHVFLGDGSGGFATAPGSPFQTANQPVSMLTGDLNGDDNADIAVDASASQVITVLFGDGNGGFARTDFPSGGASGFIGRWGLAAANLNPLQDQITDLVFANISANTVSVLQGNGMGSFSARIAFPAGVAANSVDVGDFNGDTFPDIVISSRTTSEISVLLGDGFGGFSAPTLIPVGAPGGTLVLPAVRAVDLDGDLILDLAVTNLAESTVSILIGNPAPGGGTNFAGPAGDFSTLVQNPDSTFTRTLKNGTRIEFDATGLQTAVIDRNGNSTNYAYDGQGRLTTITDPMGLVTTLAYSGDRLASVTDPALRVTSFVHDANGDLTSITDPDTSLRQFAYDARHRMTSQTSKRNFTTAYAYNFAGRHIQANLPDGSTRKVSPSQTVGVIDTTGGAGTEANPAPFTRPDEVVATFTDGNGNVKTFTLDRFGGATEVVDALNRTTATPRNADSQVTQVIAANGAVINRVYDAKGNLLTRTEAVGDPLLERTTSYTYDPVFNRVTSFTDAADKVKTINYDASGNPLTITDPLNGTRTFTHNARGQVLTRTDENSNTTTFTYDAKGNLATVTDAENNVTSFVRDAAGNITAGTEGVGAPEVRITSFTYDARNRVLTATDGSGVITQFRYDAAGNMEETENATGEIQFRSYDELDQLTVIDDPVTATTSTTYDGNGNRIQVVDGRNKVTTFEYDAANRLTKSIDPLLGETVRTYDFMNNLLTLTDPRNQTTSFEYDILNRATKRTNPLGQFSTFAYDGRDNLITVTDAKTQIITRAYDDLSRLTQVLTPDNQIDLTYGPAGNVLTVVDNDSSLAFTHDGLKRVLTADTLLGGVQPAVTLTNAYDAVGNRVTLTETGGAVTRFAHNGAGRLIGLITAANDNIDLGRDPAGRLQQILFPNTIVSDLQYDPQGRLVDVTHSVGATPLQSFAYTHDPVSNILSITEPARTRNFSYDDLERLTSGGTAGAPESYSYDGVGNRTASHLSATHVTDAGNRLTEDGSFCYAYDDNGNLKTRTAKVASACTGEVTTYSWDAQNQLILITFPDLTTAAYRYDTFGRRIEKNVDGVITRYVYDGEDVLLEYDGANTLLARYSHGEQTDQPLAVERGGQSFFYQADHQGSVTQITDAAGFVVNSYEYDSYGNIESAVEGVLNPYTYTGREFDAESGLYYYRARYYDPETGRFLKEDPIGFAAGDVNLYRYVFNNPVNFVDPDGRQAVIPIPVVVGPAVGEAIVAACIAAPVPCAVVVVGGVVVIGVGILVINESGDDALPSSSGNNAAGAVPTSPSDATGCDDDDECFRNYIEVDIPVCRAIGKRRGKNAARRCYASAEERLAACIRGKPLPPLDTWT